MNHCLYRLLFRFCMCFLLRLSSVEKQLNSRNNFHVHNVTLAASLVSEETKGKRSILLLLSSNSGMHAFLHLVSLAFL